MSPVDSQLGKRSYSPGAPSSSITGVNAAYDDWLWAHIASVYNVEGATENARPDIARLG